MTRRACDICEKIFMRKISEIFEVLLKKYWQLSELIRVNKKSPIDASAILFSSYAMDNRETFHCEP